MSENATETEYTRGTVCRHCHHLPSGRVVNVFAEFSEQPPDWRVCYCDCHDRADKLVGEPPKLQPITVIPLPYTLAEEIRRELDEAGMIDCDVSNSDVDAVIARVLIHAGKQEVQT